MSDQADQMARARAAALIAEALEAQLGKTLMAQDVAERVIAALVAAGMEIADTKFGDTVCRNAGPRRAFEFWLKAGGDTFEGASELLIELSDHAARKPAAPNRCVGGYSTGGYVELLQRPGLSHDAYVAELHAHLDAQRIRQRRAA
jgi:hypothetical protein